MLKKLNPNYHRKTLRMKKSEKNKVTMYNAVNAVLSQHQTSIDSIAPLADAVNSFKRVILEITRRDQEFSDVLGVTAAKNNALDSMTGKAYTISNALYAMARKTGNLELRDASSVSLSDFNKLRENELVQCIQRILSLAWANADAIVAYTITAEKITSLQQSLEQYRKLADGKDNKYAKSKAAREMLFDLFATAGEILKEDIDVMIELVKTTDGDFYSRYKAARTIKDLGGSQKSGAKVTDAVIVTHETAAETVTK